MKTVFLIWAPLFIVVGLLAALLVTVAKKPAPPPTWYVSAVGHREANGLSVKSRMATGKPRPLSQACAQTRSLPRASSTAQ